MVFRVVGMVVSCPILQSAVVIVGLLRVVIRASCQSTIRTGQSGMVCLRTGCRMGFREEARGAVSSRGSCGRCGPLSVAGGVFSGPGWGSHHDTLEASWGPVRAGFGSRRTALPFVSLSFVQGHQS